MLTKRIEHNFKPYKRQEQILKVALSTDKRLPKTVVVCTGRQVGKSLMSAFASMYYLMRYQNVSVGYITPVYSQGKKVFNMLKKILDSSEGLDGMVKINKSDLKIEFTNGKSISELQFFSADNYDSIRGNTFDFLIVDEAAFIKDAAWDEAIKATVMVKGKKVLLMSTPKGKNWFHKEYMKGLDEDVKSVRSYTFSSWENPFTPREELEEFKKSLPIDVYRQEILGEFIENGSEVFSGLDIFSLEVEKLNSSKYYAGIDVAQANDFTVITVMNDKGQIVEIDRFNQISYTDIVNRINNVLGKYENMRAYIEKNSIGAVVYDLLKDMKPKYRLYDWVTTNSSKDDIISQLIYAVQEGEVRIVRRLNNSDALLFEMEVYGFTYSHKTKKIVYNAKQGFNDDCVMSLAICNKCRIENKTTGNGIKVF